MDEEFEPDTQLIRGREEILPSEMSEALASLQFLGSDPFLRMQTTNIAIIDQFIMQVEAEVLDDLLNERIYIASGTFLSAQTQMWIFALYELLRTWRQRVRHITSLSKSRGLLKQADALDKGAGYIHPNRHFRASQYRQADADPALIAIADDDLRNTHIAFRQIEMLRMSFAKHEQKGRRNSAADAPGYARIDHWTGSLQYQLGNDYAVFDTITRRNIADGVRMFADRSSIPTEEAINEFDDLYKEMEQMSKSPFD